MGVFRKWSPSSTDWILAILAVSFGYSLVLLFRWVWTGLDPLETFGRIWQYYVSWTEFGFVRRGLVGTVLTVLGLNPPSVPTVYVIYPFYVAMLLISYGLLSRYIFTHAALRKDGALYAGCVFLSPAMFAHWCYGTGNLDLVLFTWAAIAMLYARRGWLWSVVAIAGILTHEMFVFLLPCLFFIRWVGSGEAFVSRRNIALLGPIAAALALVITCGRMDGYDAAAYEAIMARHVIAKAAYGYYELSSSARENTGVPMAAFVKAWPYLLLPVAYMLLVVIGVVRQIRCTQLQRFMLLITLVLPLAACWWAWDLYRWGAFSASLALLVMLWAGAHEKFALNCRWAVVVIGCFMLAPLGPDVLQRPFPLHQTILGKLGLVIGDEMNSDFR